MSQLRRFSTLDDAPLHVYPVSVDTYQLQPLLFFFFFFFFLSFFLSLFWEWDSQRTPLKVRVITNNLINFNLSLWEADCVEATDSTLSWFAIDCSDQISAQINHPIAVSIGSCLDGRWYGRFKVIGAFSEPLICIRRDRWNIPESPFYSEDSNPYLRALRPARIISFRIYRQRVVLHTISWR